MYPMLSIINISLLQPAGEPHIDPSYVTSQLPRRHFAEDEVGSERRHPMSKLRDEDLKQALSTPLSGPAVRWMAGELLNPSWPGQGEL